MVMFNIETQGTDTFLVTKLPENAKVDSLGLGMIQSNKIQGLATMSSMRMDNEEFLRYNVSSHITLQQVFQGKTDRKRFLTILKNILTTMKNLDDFMLEPGCLLLSKKEIYVNVGNMQTLLLYYPVMDENVEFSVKQFVKELIMNMEFDIYEDNSYVTELINYLNEYANVTAEMVLEQVNQLLNGANLRQMQPTQPSFVQQPSFGMQQSYQPEQMTSMSNMTQMSNQVPQQMSGMNPQLTPTFAQPTPQQQAPQPQMVNGFAVPEGVSFEKPEKKKNNSVLKSLFTKKEKEPKEKKSLGLLKKDSSSSKESKPKKDIMAPGGIVIPGMENTKNSTLPNPPKPMGATNLASLGSAQQMSQQTPQPMMQPQMQQPVQPVMQPQMQQPVQPVMQPQMQQPVQPMTQPQMQQPVQPMFQQPMQQPVQPQMHLQPGMMQRQRPQMAQSSFAAAGETMVLGASRGSEETTVLSNLGTGSMMQRRAYIVRLRTNEKVEITKDIFKMGKERNYVDYFINNNTAISRSHADIILQGENYYIVDNNSLNHTFINDQQIPSQQPTKLEEFARIKLADEVFEFRFQ